jgi:RNA polymerase sigma-70 factor (ECF subfamily)
MVDADSTDPDAALMLRVKQGDESAFEELVERWQQPVLNFVYRILPDRDEAEDLAQSVFVQLWRTAHRYEVTARFSTFLFTIARNLSLNELRRRMRHPAEVLAAGESGDDGEEGHRQLPDLSQRTADVELEGVELVSKVDEALADLPEKQRVALALCREGELSYEEIAEVLGTTVSATKSLIHRARDVLKGRLKPYLRTGTWESSKSNFLE